MKQSERIDAMLNQVADDVKLIVTRLGDLTSLSTTDKTNLVGALNEMATSSGNASIDDSKGNGDTGFTWSADKIYDAIEAAKIATKADIIDGAPNALDTLNELAAALDDDSTFATTLANDLNNKVDFSKPQPLTAAQKLQACNNLGIGNPDTDFKAAYIARRGNI